MEKGKIIMRSLIAVLIAAAGVFAYRTYSRRPADTLPEELYGIWTSEYTPQWSLEVKEKEIELRHWGKPSVTIPVTAFSSFKSRDADAELAGVRFAGVSFQWPYDEFSTAELTEGTIRRSGIRLLFSHETGYRETLWFTPGGTPAEGGPAKLPEGVRVRGLKYIRAGSYMGEYRSIYQTDEGYMVRTGYDDIELEGMTEPEAWNTGRGYDETVTLVGDEEAQKLFERILEYDVLSWNGFSGHKSLDPGILDGDESFDFEMLLSDGTLIKAEGYNMFPANFNAVLRILDLFFGEQERKAEERPALIPPDTEPEYLEIMCPGYTGDGRPYFRVKLTGNRWEFSLNDPEGMILEKGTAISEYGQTDEELPYSVFTALLEKYDMYGTESSDSTRSDEAYLIITLRYPDGERIEIKTENYPAAYEAFRKECVEAMYGEYLGLSGKQ